MSAERTLAAEVVKHSMQDETKDPNASTRMTIALLAFLAFAGAEAVRVLTRENFGRKGINQGRLWICFLCFIGLGMVGISGSNRQSENLSGTFLIVTAFYIIIEGYRKLKHAINDSNYQGDYGDSRGFIYARDGVPKEKAIDLTHRIVAPVTFIAMGVGLCFYSFLLGLPFIFCGVSVIGEGFIRDFFKNDTMENRVRVLNAKNNPTEEFNEVVID